MNHVYLPSSLQIFAKAVAKGHAFGRTATAVHAEYLHRRSYSSVYRKIYVKIVGKVLKNEARYISIACDQRTDRLYQTSRIPLLNFRVSVFIFVGSLDFTAKVSISKSMIHSQIHNIQCHTYCKQSLLADEDKRVYYYGTCLI